MNKRNVKTNEILQFIQLEGELYQLQNQENLKKKQGNLCNFIDKLFEIKEKNMYFWLFYLGG